MARMKRDLEAEAPSHGLPEHLARFTLEDWASDADVTDPANAHGVLGMYTLAEFRWGAAIRVWASDHGLTRREARALVIEPSNWNEFRQRQSA